VNAIACAAAALAAIGCAPQRDASKKLVGFSQCNNAEPWRQAMNAAARAEAARHPEIDLVISDAAQDNAKQVADVENFLTQGIDLLVISPNEAKPLTRAVESAFDKGIPVVVLDRAVATEKYTCFIGADNLAIGRAAGEWAAKTLGGRGRVVELKGLMGSTPAQERSRGFREALVKFPDVKIIHGAEAKWLRDEARAQFEHALAAHQAIDLVYAHNDPMAVGAWLAAKASGREGAIRFVGIDALPGPEGGAQAVLDGKLAATFLYPNCGKEAVETAVKCLRGEPVPKRIELPTAVVTRENARVYAALLPQ
jgi:ribose transport system substrate-binding protein